MAAAELARLDSRGRLSPRKLESYTSLGAL